jgi:transcriptional regulator with XRE-family HTH domain
MDIDTSPPALIDNRARLGGRIRAYRKMRRLTLQRLAAHAGITESFLSQIERGRSGASVGTLHLIAHALGINLTDLFDNSRGPQPNVLRAAERPKLYAEGVTKFLLTRRPLQHLEVLEGTFEAGATTGGPEYVHGDSQELVYVLEGTVRLNLADESYVLDVGDSIDFRSSTPHGLANIGAAGARVLWIISPPSTDSDEAHGVVG